MHVAVEIKNAIENIKTIQKETSSASAAPKEKDRILTQEEFDAKKKQLLGEDESYAQQI